MKVRNLPHLKQAFGVTAAFGLLHLLLMGQKRGRLGKKHRKRSLGRIYPLILLILTGPTIRQLLTLFK